MTPPRSPKQIYLDAVKPDDFADIQILDWVEGVGDVSTHYEEKFLRNYGKLLASRPATTPCEERGCTDIENCDEICDYQRIYSQADVDAKIAKAHEDVLVELKRLRHSVEFYKERCEALQSIQSQMRDPERQAVCDILANGRTASLRSTSTKERE